MAHQIPIDKTITLGYSGGFNFLIGNWEGYLSFFPIPVVMNASVPTYYRKKFAHKWPVIIYN
jgi:hypothetical protein